MTPRSQKAGRVQQAYSEGRLGDVRSGWEEFDLVQELRAPATANSQVSSWNSPSLFDRRTAYSML